MSLVSASVSKTQAASPKSYGRKVIDVRRITEEEAIWKLQNVAVVRFFAQSVPRPTVVTCFMWNPRNRSPPPGKNELLVSSVVEIEPLKADLREDFSEMVTVALSHSATNLRGYELVIKELVDPDNNEWKDLDTTSIWKASDLPDEHGRKEVVPDWLFPFAEAKITTYSSFAVIWRLKSFTFPGSSSTTTDFTCTVPDYPGVSVSIPWSAVPESENFSLTLKVQEVPCDEIELHDALAGPILHILPSQEVELSTPAVVTIPITLQEDMTELPDLSSSDVRLFHRSSLDPSPEWTEITEQLKASTDLKNGIITVQVNHFSELWPWWLKEPIGNLLNVLNNLYKRRMPKEAGFSAFLIDKQTHTQYALTLYCFPAEYDIESEEKSLCSKYTVICQGQGNSVKPLCKNDEVFVSLSDAFIAQPHTDLENLFLRFLENGHFKSSIFVTVKDFNNLKVEFFRRQEGQERRERLCTLVIIPTCGTQAASCPSLPSTSQAVIAHSQQERQFTRRCSTPSLPSTSEDASEEITIRPLKITLLADEWCSSRGGLSTINRELAIHLARQPEVKVTLLVPQSACSEEDKRQAGDYGISIIEAKKRFAVDPLHSLISPPRDLGIDVVIGHGVKLGCQAQFIKDSHNCKWVQVVHTAPEELGMFKDYTKPISKGEHKSKTEVGLCKEADQVVAVGPKLKKAYSREVSGPIFELTPGVTEEFKDLKLAENDEDDFRVLMLGRGDVEDIRLKGYDIAAKAFDHHELQNNPYRLIFVGAPDGNQDEVAERLLQYGISKKQLSVRKFVHSREELKELFRQVDLVIMPSRTEGFGLTGLEALSARLPILVSDNSGFAMALKKVSFGETCIVCSDDAESWAKAIKAVRQKGRTKRMTETDFVRNSYKRMYSWEKQCQDLVKEMRNMVNGESSPVEQGTD